MKFDEELISNCDNTKWMEGYDYKKAWRPFNRTNKVGNMTYLYNKYGRPTTTLEFYQKYTTDTTETDIPTHHGRTEDELWDIARQYRENYISATRDDYTPIETFYQNTVYHIITQTINGHKAEEEMIRHINANIDNMTATSADYILDTEYGVDVIAKTPSHELFIQVKPISFIKGKHANKDLWEDRMEAIRKHRLARETFNTETVYAFYQWDYTNTHIEWFTNDGKILQRLNQIMTDDGTSLFNTTTTTRLD